MNPLRMMRQRATITRMTPVQQAGGGYIHTPATIASNVQCSLQVTGGAEGRPQGREAGSESLQAFLPAGTDIQSADTLTVDGLTYSIVSPPLDDAGRGVYVRVLVERTEGRANR